MQRVDPARFFAGSGVVLAPHMDDEALGCGGMLALLPNKERWHVVYATDGRRSPAPEIPWRDRVTVDLREVRRQEAYAAANCLGIPAQNLHFLDLPDGGLSRAEAALMRALREFLASYRPDHVLAPFRYDRHPDHLAATRAVLHLRHDGAYSGEVTEYFVYHRWRMLPGGDVRDYVPAHLLKMVDTAPASAQKRAALDSFTSQTTRYFPWQTRAILHAEFLDDVCGQPEQFLRYDPTFPGAAIFARAALWIRFAHRVEPFLKRHKDRLQAWVQRGRGRD